jgi:hypothetical protein
MPNWLTLALSIFSEVEPVLASLFTAWNTASGTTMQKVQAVLVSSSVQAQFETIGQELFPKFAAEAGPLAAAAMAFLQLHNPSAIQWAQEGLNLVQAAGVISFGAPLKLDGQWGPLSTAAFEAAETAAGIPVQSALNDAAINWLMAELVKIG